MAKISAAIITLNEARNIERCIMSLREVVDEIVVVDSFSKDKTTRIASDLGARIIEQAFLGHIEQKNFAIAQCQHEYVLSLDADEALSDRLRTSILAAKPTLELAGYRMNRRTNYCGQWIGYGGWYPDTKTRLFQKGQGEWQGENPHDRYEVQSSQKLGFLQGDLLHYSFYTVDEHLAQIEKFTTIAAEAKWKNGERSNLLKSLVKGMARFVKGYVLKAGFLDGRNGWLIAKNSAYATFLKYHKLSRIQP